MNTSPLRFQSMAVLLLVLPAAALYTMHQLRLPGTLPLASQCAAFSIVLAAAVLFARAATVPAALVGALLAFSYGLIPGSPHSPLWLLTFALALTLGASRLGRERKRAQGTADGKHGRQASQVAANLGLGALAGTLAHTYGSSLAHTVLLATLAETTADTLASELGQLAHTAPRMMLTGRRAAPGTDGAISLPGTLAGIAGAGTVALLAQPLFALPAGAALIGFAAGVFGLFFDSLLGQLLERRHLLNNDAVNFLSTLSAAIAAATLLRIMN